MRRWFVTGAGSGFGRALATMAWARGDHVVAADVVPEGVAEAIGVPRGERLEVVALDLRDPGSIRAAADEALADGPVHVLVNNAGYAVFASQARGDVDAVAAMFEANVLGTIRVTQALLPHLRERAGTVVQISSVAGRMVLPESGFYAATKHALEALSEALAIEHAADGLKVVVVEPGAFATGFSARAARVSPPRPAEGAEVALHPRWDRLRAAVLAAPQDPDRVARAILDAVDVGRPFARVVVGDDAERLLEARDAMGVEAWVRLLGAWTAGTDAAGSVAEPARGAVTRASLWPPADPGDDPGPG